MAQTKVIGEQQEGLGGEAPIEPLMSFSIYNWLIIMLKGKT